MMNHEDYLAGMELRGFPADHPVTVRVWETREGRVRGFRSSLSPLPGECAFCYGETGSQAAVSACGACAEKPEHAETMRKLGL